MVIFREACTSNLVWPTMSSSGGMNIMERFLKRKLPPGSDEGTSQTSRNRGASNINGTTRPSFILSPRNVNLDELPYDPADRKRILEYPGLKLQDEIRRKYLIRGPHRPQPGFKYPQIIIAGKPRRFNPEWFEEYDWLEYSEKVDKAFCLYCYLFRDSIEGQAGNEEIGGDVFCLLVDESADVSDKEQMAVVLRYVDKCGVIKERLIGVVHVSETTASCLKANIDDLFTKYKLSWKQVRGQGYDGASNMRGEFNGLRALIMRENSSAYYVHCFAHQLQLVIVAVAKKNDDISDFFDMISLLLNVAGASCKRKDMIRQSQQERVKKAIGSGQICSGTGLNQEQSLQRPGDTSWCSHYKTLKSLNSLFQSIIEVLQYVEKDGPNDQKRRQARGLLDYLKDFDFVFHLHLMLMILGYANALSLCLQRKDQDILEAMSEVKSTKEKIQKIRDDGWESLLQKIYLFCEEHDIPKLDMEEEYVDRHKPRRKTNRTNYQHYRWDCLNSVVDLLLAEFNDRFTETNSNLLSCMAAFSPKDSFANFKLEVLIELAKFYPNDFSSVQLKDLAHELQIYIDNVQADERFAELNSIAELAKLMVDTKKHLAFPLVYRLLKLVLVLPVATASVERCFSAMKIVKTISRNRIGNKFMNDCIICFVEPAFLATIPDNIVIDRFQKMGDRKRKMLL